jgi:hypothetical protein
MFLKMDLFPSSSEGRKTPPLGPLESSNLNHCTISTEQVLRSPNLKKETDPVFEMLSFVGI